MPPRNIRRPAALLAAAALTVPIAFGASLSAYAAPVPSGPSAGTQKVVDLPSTAEFATGLKVENSFVSSVGWVKPGDTYPSRILLSNPTTAAIADILVRVDKVTGMTINDARAVGAGTATVAGGEATWSIPSLAPGAQASLVLEHKAASLADVPTVVWRNLSSIATVTVGGTAGNQVQSHGPKVIPPTGGFETARYGDRPFPVVPVDYADFKHTASAADLDKKINDQGTPGSTFNLFQEMSFGQLFVKGTTPSVAIGDKAYNAAADQLKFTTISPETLNTCTGVTAAQAGGTPNATVYTKRITDGWYQLPGQRGYYGQDANGSAIVGSVAGVGALQAIDSGCGPTGKAAYDAAVVADPDIDYSDYDTDKDGVVDFFEIVFQGIGGNGSSQTGGGYDNIWPHSSSLEFTYTDPVTGQAGYVSKDQLKDLEGFKLWYTDTSRTVMTRTNTGDALKVFVRVGPYNVNPETAIAKASVISHEYGHSLGLPDYYSTGSRSTYGDFNLMATDKSHNMDIIGKKELGWIVPDVLPAGQSTVRNWVDSKIDTGVINWVTPDGTPYTLDAAGGDRGIHNGQAYVAALPGRQLIDPAKVTEGKNVWFSGSGNDYGCSPNGGHNFDIAIPGIENVAAGTPVTVEFDSFFDIEWDYDYGFVMVGKPANANGTGSYSYVAQPSEEGYSTSTSPNTAACLGASGGNGLTGTGISHTSGTAAIDAIAGTYDTEGNGFVPDSYDISELAGVKGGVLRFSYYTDPGLARPGWFIDNLVVKAGNQVLYSSDFEGVGSGVGSGTPNDPALYPGGCKEDLSVSAGVCTQGWAFVSAGDPSSMEHAYLLEMRDRSGFDLDGRGENNRAAIAFQPGVLLTYTDEAHGYGNVGADNPPAQSPLDSTPTANSNSPNLNDATFTAATGRKSFTDAAATPHLDNYTEPARGAAKDGGATNQRWTFDYNCLAFTVDRMAGDTNNTLSRDLNGDVTFTTGAGCEQFNYGNVAIDSGPTPVVPEVPVAVLLPLAAAAVAAVAVTRRRRALV